MNFRAVIVLSIALIGCGTGSSHSSPTTTVATHSETSSVSQITIKNMNFSIPNEAKEGDQFTLVNQDSVPHNLMMMDESFSVDIAAGATVLLPDFTAGTYSFHCHIHPTMMGTLIISTSE